MSRKFLNGIDLVNTRAINAASPSAGTDLANKNYVDNLIQGLAWKDEVRAATTVNGTLASAYANGQVIDGVTLATGDRILIKNQTTASENGIYVVAASGAPTRATDADATAELNNATVSVLDGTVNGIGGSLNANGTTWTQTTKNPTVGSSNIAWAIANAGTSYTAGNGLQLGGGAFSVLLDTNSGLSVSGTGLKVSAGTGISTAGGTTAIDTSVVVRKYATSIGNGTNTSYTVTHNLNTLDVQVQVFDNSTTETVEADVTRTGVNTVAVAFATAPSSNAYRVLVQG